MYKWFLAWRYLHTKLIAFIGIASVMLCVAMVLTVISVLGGFLDTVKARSKGLLSEIVIETSSLQGFPMYEEIAAHLSRTMPEVVRVSTPVIFSYGIFRVPVTTYTKPARVLGIRLQDYAKVNDFEDGLHYEKYYPGTTTLAPQRMPVGGFAVGNSVVLPAELEAANRKWREAEKDPGELEKFDADPYVRAYWPDMQAITSGTRVFAVGPNAPGYEGPEWYGVVVGCDLLNFRRVDGNFDRSMARGADMALTLMPLSASGNPLGEPPVKLPLRYTDDVRTGIYEIDSMTVYVDFDMLQKQLAMDQQPMTDGTTSKPRASQLLVGLQRGVDMNIAKEKITQELDSFFVDVVDTLNPQDQRLLSGVQVFTWEDMQRDFIQAVEKEKVLITLLFSLISLVAVVLVVCIFYMIVEKKTKDIGILKALGASGAGVGTVFVLYAVAVGVIGSLLGLLVGSLFVWNINDIQDALAWLNPQLRVWTPDIYSFDRIPETVKALDAASIAVSAVIGTMVGSLIPAYIAARVWPVKALRYE
jgi:lipoprotein-releasing system permease protein